VRVTGASVDDSDVTLRLSADATPDAVWCATLEHVAAQASRLLTGVTGVVGEHRSAVAAGGWTRLRSVRETKARRIPRLTFCPVDQPGTRGAALLAACALGEGRLDELAREFALTADSRPEPHLTTSPRHKEQTPS
jgi:hypothetical protein